MSSIRDYGWLLAGVVGGVVVAAVGPVTSVRDALHLLAPLPWERIAAGFLVFWFAAALHFRQQLVRSLRRGQLDSERHGAASRLIGAAVSDGVRWLRVIQENLELVDTGGAGSREAALYLGGARAHADKLEQAFERIAGNQREADRSAP